MPLKVFEMSPIRLVYHRGAPSFLRIQPMQHRGTKIMGPPQGGAKEAMVLNSIKYICYFTSPQEAVLYLQSFHLPGLWAVFGTKGFSVPSPNQCIYWAPISGLRLGHQGNGSRSVVQEPMEVPDPCTGSTRSKFQHGCLQSAKQINRF